ncbi:hypothetical protein NM208_g13955 [Fusarium decemcellulare]|uniref:Uncharacterized protein n=1 Tax=Fusarium decemcellulare TaxID=57161 RepID=A0ACC1RHX6_9HYPO|nr:hypothetical protein NM208_g13955 [Fusarium decemcellulare]
MDHDSCFSEAARYAATSFAPEPASRIRRAVPGNSSLADVILGVIDLGDSKFNEFPRNLPEFLAATRHIFSEEYLDDFVQRRTVFDQFWRDAPASETRPSEAYIQGQTIGSWVQYMVKVIAFESQEAIIQQWKSRVREETKPIPPSPEPRQSKIPQCLQPFEGAVRRMFNLK